MIHFGRNADNDRSVGIIKGRISLTKAEIGTTYDNVIMRIEDSCIKLLRGRKIQVCSVHKTVVVVLNGRSSYF